MKINARKNKKRNSFGLHLFIAYLCSEIDNAMGRASAFGCDVCPKNLKQLKFNKIPKNCSYDSKK